MRVLVVNPNEKPVVSEIKDDLAELQEAVGGYIECVYPFTEMVGIICNEEGKLIGLEPNRIILDEDGTAYDVIVGTFLIVGLTDGGFQSLTDDQVERYSAMLDGPYIQRG